MGGGRDVWRHLRWIADDTTGCATLLERRVTVNDVLFTAQICATANLKRGSAGMPSVNFEKHGRLLGVGITISKF